MSDMTTKTVATTINCDFVSTYTTDSQGCLKKAEEHINVASKAVFDSYSCTATPVFSTLSLGNSKLTSVFILCTGTPKKNAAAK